MIVKAVSKNYIIMANKRFYSICEKLPRKNTYNFAYEGRFTIGPDNYYGYYDYYNASEEELREALLRLEDGYTYTSFANKNEHPNYYDWKKTASPITLEKGEMELGRAAVSLDNISILMTYKELKQLVEDKFVNMLLEIGIKTRCEMSEGRNTYYCFWLKDGQQRYWTNLSNENRKKVGFDN